MFFALFYCKQVEHSITQLENQRALWFKHGMEDFEFEHKKDVKSKVHRFTQRRGFPLSMASSITILTKLTKIK